MTAAVLVPAAMGVALAVLSGWMHVRGRGGDGWAVIAFCLIVTSCSRSAP